MNQLIKEFGGFQNVLRAVTSSTTGEFNEFMVYLFLFNETTDRYDRFFSEEVEGSYLIEKCLDALPSELREYYHKRVSEKECLSILDAIFENLRTQLKQFSNQQLTAYTKAAILNQVHVFVKETNTKFENHKGKSLIDSVKLSYALVNDNTCFIDASILNEYEHKLKKYCFVLSIDNDTIDLHRIF